MPNLQEGRLSHKTLASFQNLLDGRKKTDSKRKGEGNRQTDRGRGRQTDRQTDRQRERETDRQTEGEGEERDSAVGCFSEFSTDSPKGCRTKPCNSVKHNPMVCSLMQ